MHRRSLTPDQNVSLLRKVFLNKCLQHKTDRKKRRFIFCFTKQGKNIQIDLHAKHRKVKKEGVYITCKTKKYK